MYSTEAITNLSKRIAYRASLNPDFPVELSTDNSTGTSGRFFGSFHSLVTIDNIYASVEEPNMEEEDFNVYLDGLRQDVATEVLSKVLNSNPAYIDTFDYSNTIETKAGVLDECIGYVMANKVIELLVTTKRIGTDERANKLSYSILKVELDGVKNDKGFVVSKGIVYKMNAAIKTATKIIFPKEIIIQSINNGW